MSKTVFRGLAVFLFAAFAGYFIGSGSWDRAIYLNDGTLAMRDRNPAAIRRDVDFSRLDGAELMTATQKRLVEAAKVVLDERAGDVGLELGHFAVRGDDGRARLACDSFYDRMQLRLEADGIAEAGEKPVMEIDGPCRSSNDDIMAIEPIWIPVQKILQERPTNMDLSYGDDVRFTFNHMSGSWPLYWSLHTVRLYSTEGSREVKISARELREIRQRPLVLKWTHGSRIPAKTE